MVTHGRGLLCVPMTGERLDDLGLRMIVREHGPHGTAFTVSVDAARRDHRHLGRRPRARRSARSPIRRRGPEDFARPGHVFPLRAVRGRRAARAPGTPRRRSTSRGSPGSRRPACCARSWTSDGAMARLPGSTRFATKHGLRMITIKDLIAYRRQQRKLVRRVASTILPTAEGSSTPSPTRAWSTTTSRGADDGGHQRRRAGAGAGPLAVPDRRRVRLAALRLRPAARRGAGAIAERGPRRVPLHAAGGARDRAGEQAPGLRAAGPGHDTVEANQKLGFPADLRDYGIGAQILWTSAFARSADDQQPRRSSGSRPTAWSRRAGADRGAALEANRYYLGTKQDKLGHLFSDRP